jgi:hypothetical protein
MSKLDDFITYWLFNPFFWIVLFTTVLMFGILAGAHFAAPVIVAECGGIPI